MSSTGAISLGVLEATAATGGACGIELESTISGIGVLARILGASGATIVWVELSAHFGTAITSIARLRASLRVATRAFELRLMTAACSRGTIGGGSGSATSTSSSGLI